MTNFVMIEIKQKAINSVLWSAVERFSVQAIQFIIGIIIARILMPSDFGLIAMISIFIAIAQCFIDSGFANALMQKQKRTNVDFSTVFYSNILIAVFFYILFFLLSNSIARFYNEPILESLIKVLGLNLIVSSLFLVHRTKLLITLNFKALAFISIISVSISGSLGIWMALSGYGVWALVTQSMLNQGVSLVAYWLYIRWLPRPVFSFKSFRSLFGFGSKILMAGLLHTIYSNMYSLVIGRKFSAADLGFYTRGQSMAYILPSNLTTVMTQSLYPILCSLQHDSQQMRSTFLSYIRMACFVTFPIVMLVAGLAKPLVQLILTDKWIPSVVYLQILCFSYMWDPVMRMNANSLSVTGKSGYVLRSEAWKKTFSILLLVISLYFGLVVICVGMALYSLIDMLISTIYTKKVLGISFLDEIKAVAPFLLASSAMFLLIQIISCLFSSLWISVIGGCIIGVIFYLGIAFGYHWNELKILNTTLIKIFHH